MGSYIVEADAAAHDLVFRGIDGAPSPSDEENDLVTEIERTLRGLRAIYDGREADVTPHFNNLTNLARAGLSGPQAQPVLARRMLTEFRAEILEREAGPKKNRYMRMLGIACAKAGVPALVIAVLARLLMNGSFNAGLDQKTMEMISNFALVMTACTAGVWVSYGARKAQFTFEDLVVPEGDYVYPSSRIAFACILTAALTLLFSAEAIQMTIGTMTTKDLLTHPSVALIVGFLCGFSEQVLAKTISTQATRMLGGKAS